MVRRILFNILGLVLTIVAPWWAVLAYSILGALLFPWYIEMIFFGILFDVIYGNIGGFHIKHTIVFLVPLLVVEFAKPRLNVFK